MTLQGLGTSERETETKRVKRERKRDRAEMRKRGYSLQLAEGWGRGCRGGVEWMERGEANTQDHPPRFPVSLQSPVGGEGGGLLSHVLGQGIKCLLSACAKVEVFLPFPRQGSKYRLREAGCWTQGHTARLTGPGPLHFPMYSLTHPQLCPPCRLGMAFASPQTGHGICIPIGWAWCCIPAVWA